MTTIAAGASNSVTLAQGSTLKTTGTGTAVLGPGPQANTQIGLRGANAIGPFPRDQTIYVSATTAVEYAVAANNSALPVARLTTDLSNNTAGIVGPSGGVLSLAHLTGPKHTMALLGDSISAQQHRTGSSIGTSACGYATWAAWLSRQAVYTPFAMNFGVSGETTTQILARLGSVIAAAPAICVVLGGANDSNADFPASTTIANLAAIYAALVSSGIVVIAVPMTPVAYNMTTARRRNRERVNWWIRTVARDTNGIWLADASMDAIDYSNNNGDPVGGVTNTADSYTQDGLHHGPVMGFIYGQAIASAVARMKIASAHTLIASPADVYSATDNPSGNLLPNGCFNTATGGSLTGGATGVAAGNWTVQNQGAATLTTSVIQKTRDLGRTYNHQQMVFSNTLTNAFSGRIFQQIFSNVSIGDVIYAEAEVSVSASARVQEISLQCDDGSIVNRDGMPVTSPTVTTGIYYPNNAWEGVMRTQPFVCTVNNLAQLLLKVTGASGDATGVSVSMGRAAIRKVV